MNSTRHSQITRALPAELIIQVDNDGIEPSTTGSQNLFALLRLLYVSFFILLLYNKFFNFSKLLINQF